MNTQFLKDIENLDGNERLRRILDEESDLKQKIEEWQRKENLVKERMPVWKLLTELEQHAPKDRNTEEILNQVEAIREDRLFFNDPDLIKPLLSSLTDLLNKLLNQYKTEYNRIYDELMDDLQNNAYFNKLTPEQKHHILQKYQLLSNPDVKKLDAYGVNNELKHNSLNQWETKIAALSEHFRRALDEATKMAEPKAKSYQLPKQTISNKDEMHRYIENVKEEIEKLLEEGNSVIIK
jgi:Mg2+ and Co2+ transporter CorA